MSYGSRDWRPWVLDERGAEPFFRRALEAVETAARKLKRPMAQVALAWLLSRTAVTAPIIGATKLSQLDDAVEALSLRLDPDIVAGLEKHYRPCAPAGID
jgi:aryl-alcohol dehydrogenase-like predicted oxidoreductase